MGTAGAIRRGQVHVVGLSHHSAPVEAGKRIVLPATTGGYPSCATNGTMKTSGAGAPVLVPAGCNWLVGYYWLVFVCAKRGSSTPVIPVQTPGNIATATQGLDDEFPHARYAILVRYILVSRSVNSSYNWTIVPCRGIFQGDHEETISSYS